MWSRCSTRPTTCTVTTCARSVSIVPLSLAVFLPVFPNPKFFSLLSMSSDPSAIITDPAPDPTFGLQTVGENSL
jgi:hypothetical protein